MTEAQRDAVFDRLHMEQENLFGKAHGAERVQYFPSGKAVTFDRKYRRRIRGVKMTNEITSGE